MSQKSGFGRVVEKKFIPAHEEETIIPIGAIMLPDTEEVPDEFSLRVELEEKQAWVSVNKNFYEEISEGDRVYLKYDIGRFSKRLKIKDISRA